MWAPPSRVTFSMGPKGCHHPESLRWIDDATAGWAHQEPNGIRYKFSSHAYSKTFISVQSVRIINIYIYIHGPFWYSIFCEFMWFSFGQPCLVGLFMVLSLAFLISTPIWGNDPM